MEYIRAILLKETIRFLEICQTLELNGKITSEEYYSITNTKFNFLDNMI